MHRETSCEQEPNFNPRTSTAQPRRQKPVHKNRHKIKTSPANCSVKIPVLWTSTRVVMDQSCRTLLGQLPAHPLDLACKRPRLVATSPTVTRPGPSATQSLTCGTNHLSSHRLVPHLRESLVRPHASRRHDPRQANIPSAALQGGFVRAEQKIRQLRLALVIDHKSLSWLFCSQLRA